MKRALTFFLVILCFTTLSISSFAAEKSGLGSLLREVHDPSLYTPESYQPYQGAVDRAISVYENDGATQEQIDTATAELKTAKNGLVFILNRNLLSDYVAEIDGYLYETNRNLSSEIKKILTDTKKEFLSLYNSQTLTKEQLVNAEKKQKSIVELVNNSKEIQKFSAEDADKNIVIPSKVISSSNGLGRVTSLRLILLGIGIVGIILGATAAILYLKPPKFLQ